MRYQFKGKVWLYDGKAAWHFVTLPKAVSARIRDFVPRRAAYGSQRVTVTIGDTRWKTSIFPDSKAGAFLLPIKGDVRKKEGLAAGAQVRVSIELDL